MIVQHPIQVMRGPVTVAALPGVQIVTPFGGAATQALFVAEDGTIRQPTQQEVVDDLTSRGISTS